MNKQGPNDAVWRAIPGYKGVYEASNDGRVRRLAGSPKCKTNRILTPANMTSGYLVVTLCVNSKPRARGLHNLVALTFIGEPNGLWVNHKNGIKTDNRLENIEYLTPSENAQHAYDTGLQPGRAGEGNGHSILTEQKVHEIRRLASSGTPRKEIVRIIGASKTTIRDVIVGKSWSHI